MSHIPYDEEFDYDDYDYEPDYDEEEFDDYVDWQPPPDVAWAATEEKEPPSKYDTVCYLCNLKIRGIPHPVRKHNHPDLLNVCHKCFRNPYAFSQEEQDRYTALEAEAVCMRLRRNE
jgi:hypothetical protein